MNDIGFFVFLATNQAAIAHGLYAETEVGRLHARLANELAEAAAHLDDIRYCPFYRATIWVRQYVPSS